MGSRADRLEAAFGRPALSARTVVALALAALAALRLAVGAAAGLDLYFDEAQYWWWSRDLQWGYFSKPPLVAWLIAGSTWAFGESEFAIRIASPVLHAATAWLIYLWAREPYGERVGAGAALAYATLPGVSLSALLISTDVPLLFFWAAALLAFDRATRRPGLLWPALLGAAIGLGLLAKLAMGYFLLCAALCALVDREARRLVLSGRFALALALALALYAPNLAWNAAHGWATYGHTAANANWSAAGYNPGKALEFLAAQFAVAGPIAFAALLAAFAGVLRGRGDPPARRLACFSLPILAIIVVQAFIARAHANWAATAYVAGAVLAVLWLERSGRRALARASLALNLAVALIAYAALVLAPTAGRALGVDPSAPLRGWERLGAAIGREAAARDLDTIVFDDREVMAPMLYYTTPRPARMQIAFAAAPGNQFELTMPFAPVPGRRVLLVSRDPDGAALARHGGTLERVATLALPSRPGKPRPLHVFEHRSAP